MSDSELLVSADLLKVGILGGTAFLVLAALSGGNRKSKKRKYDPWLDDQEVSPFGAVANTSIAMLSLYLGIGSMIESLRAAGYEQSDIVQLADLGFISTATLGLTRIAVEAKRRADGKVLE